MKVSPESLRLYAVTDRSWLHGRSLADDVEQALLGGAGFLQLREKELDEAAFLREAREIRALTARYGVPFVINDAVEVALACAADGVHIGQEDMQLAAARDRLGPKMIIGVSVQTVAQAQAAAAAGADYLGVGAVFPTATKPDAAEVMPDTLRAICKAVTIPVVAIGGISAENMKELAGSGIDGVAVVSAIFAAADIRHAATTLHTLASQYCGAEPHTPFLPQV